MRKSVLFAFLGFLICGCVNHTFAPSPGKSSLEFEPDSARCRLFARGATSGFAFGASGSQRFVAGATAGAAIGYGIHATLEKNRNYNDCMMVRGWRVADGRPASQDSAMDGHLALLQQEATVTPLSPRQSARQFTGELPVRGDLLLRGETITPYDAEMLRMMPNSQGLLVTEVDPNGVGGQAGLRSGDVIVSFGGSPIHGVRDLVDRLVNIPPGAHISATIWRNRAYQAVEIQF